MKKTSWKRLVWGVTLMALVMGLATPAFATTGKKQMNVDYVDIKLTVDGVPAPVGTPFISEGTTYLPVRAVGEALYKEVRWDGPTHTIYIDDPTEATTETTSNTVKVDKSKKTIDVDYLDIKLVVDGKEVTPKDANGKVVEPFAYNGTTYLPIRAIGEALGKTVRWDGETKTVHLGDPLPQATYLVDVCKVSGAYVKCYRASDGEAFAMSDGKRYSQGLGVDGDVTSRAHIMFELGGKYESLTFELEGDNGGLHWSAWLDVYVDGELARKIELTKEDGIQKVTVPLNYAQVICFEPHSGHSSGYIHVANAVLNGEKAVTKPAFPANATYLMEACTVEGRYGDLTGEYDIFGNEYANGFEVTHWGNALIGLNGRYKTLKATVVKRYWNAGHEPWKEKDPIQFFVDGEVVKEFDLACTMGPQTIEIPLNYGMKLEIGTRDYVIIADAYLE